MTESAALKRRGRPPKLRINEVGSAPLKQKETKSMIVKLMLESDSDKQESVE